MSPRRYRPAAGRVRLRVERLEDRTTPATANPDTYDVFGLSFIVTAPAGVLANDTLGTSDVGPLVASLASSPPAASGALVFNPDGSFTFTPTPGFSGTVTFNYQAQGSGFVGAASPPPPSTATVTLNVVSPVASPPVPLPPPATPVPVVPPSGVLPPVSPPAVPPGSPPPPFTPLYAVGAGGGAGPLVKVFNADGSERFTLLAFDESFRGGARVAVADVTGDGVDDVVAVPGDGGGPVVFVFDGATGRLARSFELFGGAGRFGLHVAAGDLNRDGFADIVVGVGSAGGPAVQVIDGRTGTPGPAFFAYSPDFRGGVRVAVSAGDVNGDGLGEVVTVPGPSGGAVVRVFTPGGSQLSSFTALDDPTYRGGAFVTVLAGSVVVSPDSFPDSAGTGLEDPLPDADGAAATPPAGVTAFAGRPLAFEYTTDGTELSRAAVLGPDFVTGARVSRGLYQGRPGLFVSSGPAAGPRLQFYPLVPAANGAATRVLADAPALDTAPFAGGGFSLYGGGSDRSSAGTPLNFLGSP